MNTYTTERQSDSAVATDEAGNFVVVWTSYRQDGSHEGVFGQRFDAAGAPAGDEFQVNSYTTSSQRSPALAVAPAGDFVVIWSNLGPEPSLLGQRFTSSGTRLGSEIQVNSYPAESLGYPSVAAFGSGDFVVVWQGVGRDGSDDGVFGQRFASTGVKMGTEFQINTYTSGVQAHPVVAADDSGNFVVAWHSYRQDGSSHGVFAQRFDSTGDRAGTEFQVNSYTTNVQWVPGVAMDGAGNFVVVWNSLGQDGFSWGVFGQRFGASGSRVGQEFQVNSYTTNYQTSGSSVALDDDGNFVVAWNGYPDQDGSSTGLFAQQFLFAGGPVGSEFQVNTYTTMAQRDPSVAVGVDRSFIVTWDSALQDGSDIGIMGRQLETSIPACAADGDTLCLHNNRFRIEVSWTNYAGTTGNGQAVPFTGDSGLFWFFGPGNLEMLVKIVDGCNLNQRFWVYAGATTDVEYLLTVTDTTTDTTREYRNLLGHRAAAITDSDAFATCEISQSGATAVTLLPATARAASFAASLADSNGGTGFGEADCSAGDHDLCLRDDRFRARVTWTDYAGRTGSGWAVPYADESGMFWFFDGDNIEFVVKVIDACSLNSRYWVYAAATTDVAYTLTVTDTRHDTSKSYTNLLGTASPAITDSSAFATCP